MGYYLLDHPNHRYKQYRTKRRTDAEFSRPAHGGRLTGGIILHSAEGGTDLVGADMTAENVARYISTRSTPGSYHTILDRDTRILLLPSEYEAWHDTTSNPYTVGISVAWNKADLARMSYAQRLEYYNMFADAVIDEIKWMKVNKGITVPINRYLSRNEIIAGKPGISTHSRMDPGRRSDAFGTGSVYEREFLAVLQGRASGKTEPSKPKPKTIEEEIMAFYKDRAEFEKAMTSIVERRNGFAFIQLSHDGEKGVGAVYATNGIFKVGIRNPPSWAEWRKITGTDDFHKVSPDTFNSIVTVRDETVLNQLTALTAVVKTLAEAQSIPADKLVEQVLQRVDEALEGVTYGLTRTDSVTETEAETQE